MKTNEGTFWREVNGAGAHIFNGSLPPGFSVDGVPQRTVWSKADGNVTAFIYEGGMDIDADYFADRTPDFMGTLATKASSRTEIVQA